MIDAITNFVESSGNLIAANDVDIDTFVKDTHYANNGRVVSQKILISNNVTQGLKYMFLNIKNIYLLNYLPR